MIFPFLIFLLALVAVLGYFARKNVTWTSKPGTGGSVGMAIVVFIIFALIGWGLDVYLEWSIIPTYMYAVGGSLQAVAILFWCSFALLCLSMLSSAAKVGTMVS